MITYTRWLEDSKTAEQELKNLMDLFTYVLLQTSGDVQRTIDLMGEIDDQYGIMKSVSMDDFLDQLRSQKLIEEDEHGQLLPTARSERAMRTQSLREIFSSLKKSDMGQHDIPSSGRGIERLPETRSFAFGDQASNIDITQTFTNLMVRTGDVDGTFLHEDDVKVYETEMQTTCATVLMIDISHSMILYGEDRITPAKQVALALTELIQSSFPKDMLEVIVFGDEARRVAIRDIPYIQVGPFHTNTRDGLRLARTILKRQRNVNKQIFMITDGKPSALTMENSSIYKNSWGLDSMIVNKTLDESVACRRDGITISTFMVAQDPYLVQFIEQLTAANKGRAFYTGLDGLGKDLVVDYMKNRRGRR